MLMQALHPRVMPECRALRVLMRNTQAGTCQHMAKSNDDVKVQPTSCEASLDPLIRPLGVIEVRE